LPHLDQANAIAFEKTPALFAIEKSSGIKLVEKGARAGTGGCYTLVPKAEPQNLGQMVISNREDNRIIRTQDRIARVDIYKGSSITTISGAKIGDTEARIKSLYPGQIRVRDFQTKKYSSLKV
jgi:hypothetical protein